MHRLHAQHALRDGAGAVNARHVRRYCASPTTARAQTELRNRHWASGYIPLLRGELNTARFPESRPSPADWSAPTPGLLQAVLDGLRKL